jgi:DNA-binding transcriptional LysR family regulator
MEVVGTEPMIFIVAPSHKLAHRKRRPTARELADEPFVVAPKGTGYRQITDQVLAGQGIENVRVLMEVGVVESIKGAVQEGIAVGVTLRSAVAWEIEQGWLCEVEPPRGRTMVDLALVYRPHRQASPMLQAFLGALRMGLSEQQGETQTEGRGDGRSQPGDQPASGATARRLAHSR